MDQWITPRQKSSFELAVLRVILRLSRVEEILAVDTTILFRPSDLNHSQHIALTSRGEDARNGLSEPKVVVCSWRVFLHNGMANLSHLGAL